MINNGSSSSSCSNQRQQHQHLPSQNEQQEEEDRISSLPDSLLITILSLLPINSAAATSALSHHHWRHLWTHITHLSLDFPYNKPFDSILTIINHIFSNPPKFTLFTFVFQQLIQPTAFTPVFRYLVSITFAAAILRCFLSGNLKRVDIREVVPDDSHDAEMKLIKHILSNAMVLEKLRLYVADNIVSSVDEEQMEFEFCKKLFNLPKSSVNCQIEFYGAAINASSKDFIDGALTYQTLDKVKHAYAHYCGY